jgi:hypothetical protein
MEPRKFSADGASGLADFQGVVNVNTKEGQEVTETTRTISSFRTKINKYPNLSKHDVVWIYLHFGVVYCLFVQDIKSKSNVLLREVCYLCTSLDAVISLRSRPLARDNLMLSAHFSSK